MLGCHLVWWMLGREREKVGRWREVGSWRGPLSRDFDVRS
jgi:hypothetical protein